MWRGDVRRGGSCSNERRTTSCPWRMTRKRWIGRWIFWARCSARLGEAAPGCVTPVTVPRSGAPYCRRPLRRESLVVQTKHLLGALSLLMLTLAFGCGDRLTGPEVVQIVDALEKPFWTDSSEARARLRFHGMTAIWAERLSRFHNVSSVTRSEEHTSELQSQSNLVCRLLLE